MNGAETKWSELKQLRNFLYDWITASRELSSCCFQEGITLYDWLSSESAKIQLCHLKRSQRAGHLISMDLSWSRNLCVRCSLHEQKHSKYIRISIRCNSRLMASSKTGEPANLIAICYLVLHAVEFAIISPVKILSICHRQQMVQLQLVARGWMWIRIEPKFEVFFPDLALFNYVSVIKICCYPCQLSRICKQSKPKSRPTRRLVLREDGYHKILVVIWVSTKQEFLPAGVTTC